MDATFITVHALTSEARILYSSDSIVDVLGHRPHDVLHRSLWQFFHPKELSSTKVRYGREAALDRAAVLFYCLLKNRGGDWVDCECCFSIVCDTMVCCTRVYRNGEESQRRTFEASIVRRLFSPSPTDPRYHMLADLSKKFDLGPENQTHEARAALFLNRFTRTLTIMYATSSIERIVGLPKEELERKSFYYCITLECLADAVRHLESAKGIDSIAYMRFMFRDPRQNYHVDLTSPESQDHEMRYVASDNDRRIVGSVRVGNQSPSSGRNLGQQISGSRGNGEEHPPTNFHTGPADSTAPKEMLHSVLDGGSRKHSTTTSLEGSPHIELEAVVSCTTDGLVVCLRRARPARLGTMPASR